MLFIPLQKWYDIILCCHSNRRVQTLMVSWLWRRVIYGINLRVLVAMVIELVHPFHSAVVWNEYHALQWYETNTMLCSGMKCIPVLILKSQRHTFSQQIIFLKPINSLFSMIAPVAYSINNMSLVTRKPVFGVCDQVRLKPACSASEAS